MKTVSIILAMFFLLSTSIFAEGEQEKLTKIDQGEAFKIYIKTTTNQIKDSDIENYIKDHDFRSYVKYKDNEFDLKDYIKNTKTELANYAKTIDLKKIFFIPATAPYDQYNEEKSGFNIQLNIEYFVINQINNKVTPYEPVLFSETSPVFLFLTKKAENVFLKMERDEAKKFVDRVNFEHDTELNKRYLDIRFELTILTSDDPKYIERMKSIPEEFKNRYVIIAEAKKITVLN